MVYYTVRHYVIRKIGLQADQNEAFPGCGVLLSGAAQMEFV